MVAIVYTPEEIAILEGGRCNYAGLVKVEMSPEPVRIWTGFGDLPIQDSAFDDDGDAYKSGSRLVALPVFQRLVNAIAERVTYTMAAVTDAMLSLARESADDVRGAIVRLGIIVMADDFGQVGPVRWIRRGRADVIETKNIAEGGGRIRTIEISAGSLATGRKVPGQGTFTDADQQSRPGSEDDRFCERTPKLTITTLKKWPP